MSDPKPPEDHPLSMPLPEADVALLDNATVRMGPDAFAAFEAAIASEGLPVPELVELFRRPAPWDQAG